MRVFLVFLLALGLASPAQAYLKAGPIDAGSGHRLQGMIAPLDGGGAFSTPAAAYSLRRLKSTYAGPAIRLRRASDNATQDIGFLGFTGFTGAPVDMAAAAAFCAATTCQFVTMYDQSGNARDATQATAGNQPDYLASCIGTLPCARTTWAGITLDTASVTWTAALTSLSTVARRAAGTGQCFFILKSLNNISSNTVNDWQMTAFSGGQIDAAAADNVWHAALAVLNGVSSVLRVDSVETPGNVIADGGAGAAKFNSGAASTTCDVTESVIWDGYALPAAERAALQTNQKSYWGLP